MHPRVGAVVHATDEWRALHPRIDVGQSTTEGHTSVDQTLLASVSPTIEFKFPVLLPIAVKAANLFLVGERACMNVQKPEIASSRFYDCRIQ